MKQKRTVELCIPSELGYEKLAISMIALLAQEMGFSAERIDDLKTAVGEAVSNAIEHGNQLNRQLSVQVIALVDEDSLTLKVIDQKYQSLPELTLTRQERADHRGWGMFLIQRLVDEVTAIVTPSQNILQMVIYLIY
jgi:serine/threonine-protein kinase RsbW